MCGFGLAECLPGVEGMDHIGKRQYQVIDHNLRFHHPPHTERCGRSFRPAEDRLDIFFAVMERLQMETVVVTCLQCLEDGDEAVDRVIQSSLRLTKLPPLSAGLHILPARLKIY